MNDFPNFLHRTQEFAQSILGFRKLRKQWSYYFWNPFKNKHFIRRFCFKKLLMQRPYQKIAQIRRYLLCPFSGKFFLRHAFKTNSICYLVILALFQTSFVPKKDWLSLVYVIMYFFFFLQLFVWNYWKHKIFGVTSEGAKHWTKFPKSETGLMFSTMPNLQNVVPSSIKFSVSIVTKECPAVGLTKQYLICY